jgi:transposase
VIRAPSPENEDRRRLKRERGPWLKERIQHTNRIRGPARRPRGPGS